MTTMTAEQKKIKRLEAQVRQMKETVKDLEIKLYHAECKFRNAIEWRQSFQNFVREVVQF
jgi:hypothetical protein